MAAEGKGEVVLLDFWVSPYAQRVRIALAEKGVKYESLEQDFPLKGELLLQSNPVHKKLPVLLHHGKPVAESLIIVQYIDEVWPGKGSFMPSDPYARAQARFWVDYIEKKLLESMGLWKLKGEAQEEAKKDCLHILKVLEGELGEKKYFAGDDFGYVDIALIPFPSWFYSLEKCADFTINVHFPKLMEWVERCKERKSVAETLTDPGTAYEYNCSWKKKYGIE